MVIYKKLIKDLGVYAASLIDDHKIAAFTATTRAYLIHIIDWKKNSTKRIYFDIEKRSFTKITPLLTNNILYCAGGTTQSIVNI